VTLSGLEIHGDDRIRLEAALTAKIANNTVIDINAANLRVDVCFFLQREGHKFDAVFFFINPSGLDWLFSDRCQD
jgi:hypothetical protein